MRLCPTRIRELNMKKLYLFLAMIAIAGCAFAQDTIVLRDGSELQVKVEKVTDEALEFHMWSNLNGPLRVKKVSDVFMVKYSDGSREVFEAIQTSPTAKAIPSQYETSQSGNYMEAHRGDLEINGESLDDEELVKILDVDQYSTYRSATRMRRAGSTLKAIGWPFFSFGAVLTTIGYGFYWNATNLYDVSEGLTFLAIGWVCVGLGTTMLIPGYVLKGIGNGRVRSVADSYNRQNALSLELSPSLMPTMNGDFGYGAGITLRF